MANWIYNIHIIEFRELKLAVCMMATAKVFKMKKERSQFYLQIELVLSRWDPCSLVHWSARVHCAHTFIRDTNQCWNLHETRWNKMRKCCQMIKINQFLCICVCVCLTLMFSNQTFVVCVLFLFDVDAAVVAAAAAFLCSVAGAVDAVAVYYDGLFFFGKKKLCYFFYHAFLHASRFNNKRMLTMAMMSFFLSCCLIFPNRNTHTNETNSAQLNIMWCDVLLLLFAMLPHSVCSVCVRFLLSSLYYRKIQWL